MIKRSEVIENVKENSSTVIKFLGFIKKSPPPIVVRKIKEELEKFEEYIEMEYEYKVFEENGEMYADILYTIGNKLEGVIQKYLDNGEGMRAMIMDKIGVVTLDEIKEGIENEIYSKYGYSVTSEGYPGSPRYPLSIQKEILDKMENVKSIEVNEYFQLNPVKSVALRLSLSKKKSSITPAENVK